MDDLISRQAALVAIQNLYPDMPRVNVFGSLNRWREKNEQYIECEEAIKKLPSVKRKKGKWIVPQHDLVISGTCSCCETTFYTDMCEYIDGNVPKFCPWCGADMRGDGNDN